jgi:hypothetical protein
LEVPKHRSPSRHTVRVALEHFFSWSDSGLPGHRCPHASRIYPTCAFEVSKSGEPDFGAVHPCFAITSYSKAMDARVKPAHDSLRDSAEVEKLRSSEPRRGAGRIRRHMTTPDINAPAWAWPRCRHPVWEADRCRTACPRSPGAGAGNARRARPSALGSTCPGWRPRAATRRPPPM